MCSWCASFSGWYSPSWESNSLKVSLTGVWIRIGQNVDARVVPNKAVCCAKASTHDYSWVNTVSNYDNVFEGYLSLLQIVSSKSTYYVTPKIHIFMQKIV